MDFLAIFSIIVILLVIILVTKLVKGFFKALFLVSMILTLIFGVFGYFVYTDAMEFKQGWESSPKVFLLHDNSYLISGFKADPAKEETIESLNHETITTYKEFFSKNEYDKILDENYKLFLIDYSAFKEVPNIELLNTKLSLAQTKDLLESATPTKDFALITTGQDLAMEIDSKQDDLFKSSLFAVLFATSVNKEGPLFIIQKVKSKEIQVYPETALFKSLRLIPFSVIKQAFAQVIEAGAEGATTAAVAIKNIIVDHKGDIIDIIG